MEDVDTRVESSAEDAVEESQQRGGTPQQSDSVARDESIVVLRKRKAQAKGHFTNARRALLVGAHNGQIEDVEAEQSRLQGCMEEVAAVIDELLNITSDVKEKLLLIAELETLQAEYSAAVEDLPVPSYGTGGDQEVTQAQQGSDAVSSQRGFTESGRSTRSRRGHTRTWPWDSASATSPRYAPESSTVGGLAMSALGDWQQSAEPEAEEASFLSGIGGFGAFGGVRGRQMPVASWPGYRYRERPLAALQEEDPWMRQSFATHSDSPDSETRDTRAESLGQHQGFASYSQGATDIANQTSLLASKASGAAASAASVPSTVSAANIVNSSTTTVLASGRSPSITATSISARAPTLTTASAPASVPNLPSSSSSRTSVPAAASWTGHSLRAPVSAVSASTTTSQPYAGSAPVLQPAASSSQFRGHQHFQAAMPRARPPPPAFAPPPGHEPWTQMKRVSIETFTGDKRRYEEWKASFIACVDSSPATPEYKFLQMKQFLGGDALQAVANLGYTQRGYDTAKARLEKKFGGKRRQVAMYVEELARFTGISGDDPRELERFADLLEVATVNLQDAGHFAELQAGTFYMNLLRKLSEKLVAQYQRWLFEQRKQESVLALLEWATQEAEFLVTATETVRGMTRSRQPRWSKPTTNASGNSEKARTYASFSTSSTPQKPQKSPKCPTCEGEHGIWRCKAFLEMDNVQRWTEARRANLCYRCLAFGHRGGECKRGWTCGVNGCQDNHHRLLHATKGGAQKGTPSSGQAKDTPSDAESKNRRGEVDGSCHAVQAVTEGELTAGATMAAHSYSKVALRIVPVMLRNGPQEVTVNALLDDASTTSYINTAVAGQLGISGTLRRSTVSTLNGKVETFMTAPVSFTIASMDNSYQQSVTAFTTTNVTGDLQPVDWSQEAEKYGHLRDIPFPALCKPNVIELLIGSDNAELMMSRRDISGAPGQPIARQTPLGWTCVGKVHAADTDSQQEALHGQSFLCYGGPSVTSLEATLQRFWEVERYGMSDGLQEPGIRSAEDESALKTVQRAIQMVDGRYQVSIPWNSRKVELTNNIVMARKRLTSTERRLQKDSTVAAAYRDVLKSYEDKGYIRELGAAETEQDQCWYLPHFAIVRPQKTTTKVRIVFDAAANYRGLSLNDAINPGQRLQRDLCDVLTRFRRKPVAIGCDISEMYLQVALAPEDKPYHRFLWRDRPDADVQHYEFNRLVFGINASPFLAQYVAQQTAREHAVTHPLAADAILASTYMDDTMDSVDCEEDGRKLYRELRELWGMAKMRPRKWISNSATVLADIPTEDRASQIELSSTELPAVKTLGVAWKAAEDHFTFHYTAPEFPDGMTKRALLRKIATVFDPLGFISPFIIRAKTLLQDCWIAGTDWDEPAPSEIAESAQQWFSELCHLDEIKVQRCLAASTDSKIQLHIFSDASSTAYGAVIYARTTRHDGTSACRFIMSKGRVAPTKAVSIPRLELMAAMVGLRAALTTTRVLQLDISTAIFWSDSCTVLQWIRSYSRRFKPFVANRVGTIQESTAPRQWRYVPSKSNPADILSRGMSVEKLAHASLWWQGPAFLTREEDWPEMPVSEQCSPAVDEIRKATQESSFITVHQPAVQPFRFSSWTKLVRVQAWVSRFINNCRKEGRLAGELTADEIADAEKFITHVAQSEAYGPDIKLLRDRKQLPSSSRLAKLSPRLDADGLVRCDGRTGLADWIPYDTRFPVILPRRHPVTGLIVKHFHEQRQHGGTNETLAEMSQGYLVEAAREEIREWEKKCMVCRRHKARPAEQQMAPLPAIRLSTPLRAFARVSVDYGSPFETVQGRGKQRRKRYVCLFTCLLSRAVHLEMAYALDANSFLNAFSRMVNRRGRPFEVISDNGGNFVSADRQLREDVYNDKVKKTMASQRIKWTFNPPLAPHFGGVHEIMIKAAKKALRRILGDAQVTDEELVTALSGAEALLNSRPLTYQSANPSDPGPLTPNHFLHGRSEGQLVSAAQNDDGRSVQRRWRHVQMLVEHFWRRWLREWVPTLNQRKKWLNVRRDLAVGDVVLLIDPATPRGQWRLARIIEVYPGPDGHVRVVKLQAGNQQYKRPISRVCPLEC
ncbi:uncharacterized protein LOC135824359 [Sycon ciliatum]|uniref:uncharacterized protein LOC135824359 n=1 Tax=Sycon ciliatum TaxID=27933 RepID=UPI0031F5F456